jgi:MOSC domain-containing protein YiiM
MSETSVPGMIEEAPATPVRLPRLTHQPRFATTGLVAGIDIGGTKQTVALARLDGEVVATRRRRLRPGGTAEDVVTSILEMIETGLATVRESRGQPGADKLLRIGVGFGGPVDPKRGAIVTSHHVPGWDDYPLRETLERRLDAQAVIDNDANAAALGEAEFGAGRGHRHLLSVNVGSPRTVPSLTGKRMVRTAIWKTPVEGRVAVRGINVEGDEQADRRVHGGEFKAVYAYALEEIRAWEDELGRAIGPGGFGETFTLEGVDVSGARAGERWAIGSALFEVVQPRVPCFKLNLRLGDPKFGRRFTAAGRPGAYLRIVEDGEVGAGDEVRIVRRPQHDVTMRLMMHALLVEKDRLPDLLAAPELIAEWRDWIEERTA